MRIVYLLIITILLAFPIELKGQENNQYNTLISQGEQLLAEGKFISSTKIFKEALAVLKDSNRIQKIKTFYLIGNGFKLATSLDSAQFYYDKGNLLFNEQTPVLLKSKKYHNKASIHYAHGRTDSAMFYSIKALDLAKATDDLSYQSMTYSNLGDIFFKKQVLKKAQEYYDKSIELAILSNDLIAEAEALQRIGQLQLDEKNYEQAETNFKKAMALYEKRKDKLGLLTSKSYLSKVYFFNGNMEKAAQIGFELMPLLNEIEFVGKAKQLVDNTNKMVAIPKNGNLNDLQEAKELMEQNIELTEVPEVNIEQNKSIIKFFEEEKKQIKDSSLIAYGNESLEKKLNEILKTKDSLYQISLNNKFTELETKYKTEQKEKELVEQKIAMQEQLLLTQKANSQKWIYLFLLIISILIILLLISYFKGKAKKQTYKNELEILKAKQQEQKMIGIELHDTLSKKLEEVTISLNKAGQKAIAQETDLIRNEIRTLSSDFSLIDFEESEFDEQLITLGARYSVNKLKINYFNLNSVNWVKVSNPLKHNLFLIIREAVSNTFNHANASTLDIKFHKDGDLLNIEIKDNGSGFDSIQEPGNGLRNLKLRVNEIKGDISIKSAINDGTKLNISLNLF